ncbi:MAG: TonB-dependent hemoglobin/transferrin/lactoferrin family receptor [Pseudomonadales bacterium]|nr:TonB-dependent hemoglobin/transferrin/lactoferrin family receptor [Pseudomonadales bacterium]
MKSKNLFMCKYILASYLILISGLLSLPDAFAQASQVDKTIQEIVVISSRKPIAKSDVVGSVSSISEAEIAARMVNDMQQLFATTPGVGVKRRSAYGRMYNEGISIRGLGGKRVNILIDGARVPDAYTGYGRDVVEIDLLKRVEVLKGPSSALYGSDGLAGAVAYTTKDPSDYLDGKQIHVSSGARHDSSSDRNKFSILAAGAYGDIEAMVQVVDHSLSERNLHDDVTMAANGLDGEQESLFTKLKYNLNDSISFTLTADEQNWSGDWNLATDVGMSFFPAIVNTSSSLGQDRGFRDRYSLDIDLEINSIFAERASVKFYSQTTEQSQMTTKEKQTFGRGPQFGPTSMATEISNYHFNQEVTGISAQLSNTFKTIFGHEHDLVYGFENESIETQRPRSKLNIDAMSGVTTSIFGADRFPNKTFPDTEVKRIGIFANDRINVTDRATFVLGLRYDSYDLEPTPDALFSNSNVSRYDLANIDDSAISSKIGLMYDLSDGLSAYMQYAEGFRSPDYESANLTFTNFAYYYSVAPNPDLDSEESSGYEVGLRGNIDNHQFSLAAYDTDYENFIDTAVTGATPQGIVVYQYVNLNDAEIKGIEASYQTAISDHLLFKLGANRTFGTSDGEKLINISPSKAVLSLAWKSSNEKIKVNSLSTLVASSPSNLPPSCGRGGCNDLVELGGRVTHDIFGSYQVSPDILLKFGISNITDKKYWNWTTVSGKTINDPNLEMFVEPGREFNAEVKYTF